MNSQLKYQQQQQQQRQERKTATLFDTSKWKLPVMHSKNAELRRHNTAHTSADGPRQLCSKLSRRVAFPSWIAMLTRLRARLIYSRASVVCLRHLKNTISQDKKKDRERLMFGMIGTSNSTPRTWKRMAPSSCNAASAPVYETTFTLGQYSHVHPARLEWYIVGARWLAGGSTVQSLNRQRTHGSSVQLTAASFAYSPRAVTRWQSKKKKKKTTERLVRKIDSSCTVGK